MILCGLSVFSTTEMFHLRLLFFWTDSLFGDYMRHGTCLLFFLARIQA